MNTLRKYGAKYNVTFCTFAGLSTDTKPVGTTLIDNKSVALANGSEFIEMDTDKKYLYDAENQQWNLASSGGGGGGSAILIEKSITENGEYNASDDNADGYKKVTVDVAGGGSGTTLKKDVNFYDYDGTIVNSYTASEFAELSALPDNPTHEGLTAQGWNWSLADAKTYVANYGKLNIGQMYITDDGKTRLYISLSEGRTSPILKLYLNDNSELDIDWGDGGTHSTFTATSADYKSERHEYSTYGDYVIAITVVNGGFALESSSSSVSSILWDGNGVGASPDRAYNNAIKKVEIGDGVTSIGSYAFYNCRSLSSVTIPNGVTSISGSTFQNCYSLPSITIPNSITSINGSTFYYCYALSSVIIPDSVTSIGSYAFATCSSLSSVTIPDSVTSIDNSIFSFCQSLSSVTIPDSVTSIDNSAFYYCSALSSVIIPDSVTSIGQQAFYYCASLSSVTIPDSVTSINSNAFRGCSYMSYIKFESATPPTVANSNAWQDVSTSTKILVPAGTLETYKSATNYPNSDTYTYEEY